MSAGSPSVLIAASLLGADPLVVGPAADEALAAGADWLHIDVMDGHFVPDIAFGTAAVRALRRRFPDTFLDVHLMVDAPERLVADYAAAGANCLTVHLEACRHPHRTLQAISTAGCRAGLALNPGTPVGQIAPLLAVCDLVLIMGVNPGFGGQQLIPATVDRLGQCAGLIRDCLATTSGKDVIALEVDGGVREDNAAALRTGGADVLVAGQALFHAADLTATISALRHESAP